LKLARADERLENQHYVPKMLLRNFGFGKKREQIHVFDKTNGRIFQCNINKVAAEKGCYDALIDGKVSVSLEPHLSRLESGTNGAFKKVIETRSIAGLSGNDRSWIGVFVAAQFLRTKNFRETIKALSDFFAEQVKNTSGGMENISIDLVMSEDEIRGFSIEFFAKSIRQFSDLMHQKVWALMETEKSDPFWIGDHPVAMHNDQDFGPYGNIGFAVSGIQIYLPLSPTLTLVLWCPTLVRQIEEDLERAKHDRQNLSVLRALGAAPDFEGISKEIDEWDRILAYREEQIACIAAGQPFFCSPDNVMFLNSLQVHWSERFVMSKGSDFSLAYRMIGDNEKFRQGIRFRTN
jgi:hypothetical protein